MRMLGCIVLAYGLVVLLGGIFGYVKAESVPSLVMGVIFATTLSVSSFLMFNGSSYGYYGSVVATLLLLTFFIYRYAMTMKIMPAGLMCVLSMIVLVILLFKQKT